MAPKAGRRPFTTKFQVFFNGGHMLEIQSRQGITKCVEVRHFSALDGWELQNNFKSFAASLDKEYRRAYTMEILSYATVVFDGREIPLSTDALIDNHLEHWHNIQLVFEEVLRFNGIDPTTHADKPDYWAAAGAEMAVAFIAEASKLMGPGLEIIGRVNAQG